MPEICVVALELGDVALKGGNVLHPDTPEGAKLQELSFNEKITVRFLNGGQHNMDPKVIHILTIFLSWAVGICCTGVSRPSSARMSWKEEK